MKKLLSALLLVCLLLCLGTAALAEEPETTEETYEETTEETTEEPERCNVTLWGCGGEINSMVTSYTPGEEVVLPTDCTREGCEFAGWYTDPEYSGEPWTVIPADCDDGDLNFYAKWEDILEPVTVTLVIEDPACGTFENGKTTYDFPVWKGSAVYFLSGSVNGEICTVYCGASGQSHDLSTTVLTSDYWQLSGLEGLPEDGKITEPVTLTLKFDPVYLLTIQISADNRGYATVNGEDKIIAFKVPPQSTLSAMDNFLGYDYMGLMGDGFYAEAAEGYRFVRWDGIPEDSYITDTTVVTAVFEPVANITMQADTVSAVADSVEDGEAVSSQMSKAGVSGIEQAMDGKIMEFLFSQGLSLEEAEDADVEISATVDVEVTDADLSGEEGTLSFSVKPRATVTLDGETLVENAAVSNDYLSGQKIAVTIPCCGITPEKIEHRSGEDNHLIETFTADGDPAFVYDAETDTVTVEITEFSTLNLIGALAEEPAEETTEETAEEPTPTEAPKPTEEPKKKAPSTGDEANALLYFSLLAVSAGAAVLLSRRKANKTK